MPTLIENTTTLQPLIIPLGIVSAAITDKITKNGESIDMNGKEVRFFMRPIMSRHPVIEGESAEVISPPDNDGNNVKYQWQEEDVATEGEYMAWWSFTEGEQTNETPEFKIIISDHGPGLGTATGGIVDGAADFMPTTFSALRRDPNFGDRRLQKYATLIQIRITNAYVQPDEEITSYSLPLLDYFSKRLAFELCTPGIDYWARQARTTSAQSPTEITSYPDMIASLGKLRERLQEELEQDWRELRFLVPNLPQRKVVSMPASSLEYEDYTGPSGELIARNGPIEPVTRDPRNTQRLLTNSWGFLDPFLTGFFPFP